MSAADELSELEPQELTAEVQRLREKIDKLEAFKRYVHERLDAANVPHNPEPERNAQHGCRIEGRLNWLEKQLAKAKQESSDWSKHWGQLDRERSSLKGRITTLRSALKNSGALATIEYDDERRRRFEKRERRR